MESLTLEQKVMKFLGDGSGDGSGDGNGSGYGDGSGSGYGSGSGDGSGSSDGSGSGSGYGSGDGSGSGYGSGSGSGYGLGYGSGSGDGIKAINGQQVYMVDGISTLIDVCHDAYAMGSILHSDLTTEKCFVVKQNKMFAHGKTLRDARDALLEKLFDDMPEPERIEKFVDAHSIDGTYPNIDFFNWHHRLTGSCEQGRKAFAMDHGIDLSGSMTTSEFLELTKDDYGGDIIKRVIDAYKEGD